MTAVPARHQLWDRFPRSLLPTYGARANAADSLADLRRTRSLRASAADALAHAERSARTGSPATGRSVR